MSPPSPEKTSWILEVRKRLENPAPTRLQPRRGVEARHAAVLVPLYVDGGAIWTVLTRRSDQMAQHRGQIAFPGGAHELGEDAWAAALRETEEELGIPGRAVLPLGQLDEAETPSGFRIVPCVGALPWPIELRPNREEIDEVFSVPLFALADPRVVEEKSVKIEGRPRALRVYHVGGRAIWGLTARIVETLLERLAVGLPG